MLGPLERTKLIHWFIHLNIILPHFPSSLLLLAFSTETYTHSHLTMRANSSI
jgi:hypothetical protein